MRSNETCKSTYKALVSVGNMKLKICENMFIIYVPALGVKIRVPSNISCLGMGHEHFWTSGTDQAEEGKSVTSLYYLLLLFGLGSVDDH